MHAPAPLGARQTLRPLGDNAASPGSQELARDGPQPLLAGVAEAYRHAKPVAAIGAGIQLLTAAPIPELSVNGIGTHAEAGVVTAAEDETDLSRFGRLFTEALAAHRHHNRNLAAVPA